tara:strand:+ start:447 stop:923 length:477 start_codon:yes stop_codon:yes gene_type:complete
MAKSSKKKEGSKKKSKDPKDPNNKDKGPDKKKKSPHITSCITDKNSRLLSYVKKIAKELSDERGEDGNKDREFTMTSQAAEEMELLIEHAIANIAHNTGAILKYSQAGTIGQKTIQLATKLAFDGLLRDSATSAGSKALDTYDASIAEAAPPVAAVEP